MTLRSAVGALLVAISLSGCGGGGAQPGGCGSGGSPDISNPGAFSLFVDGPGESTVVDNLDNSGAGLTQTNTCSGTASVDFVYRPSSSDAALDVTPIAVGNCTITISDGHECLTDQITVHPGSGLPSSTRRSKF